MGTGSSAMSRSRFTVCLLFVSFMSMDIVSADAPAASSLKEQVALINSGKFANNFFEGSLASSAAVEHQVGGCLLDKVQAIQDEDGMSKFPNDLKVDLAACCTKGDSNTCITKLSPVYNLITAAEKEGSSTARVNGALTILKRVAKLLLQGATVSAAGT